MLALGTLHAIYIANIFVKMAYQQRHYNSIDAILSRVLALLSMKTTGMSSFYYTIELQKETNCVQHLFLQREQHVHYAADSQRT